MEIIKMTQIPGKEVRGGVTAKQLIKHEHVKVMNIILNPGDVIPKHQVPVDVFFYVIEGKGTLTIGEESAVVSAEDIILCPPNTDMSLVADQNERFIVLNVKTPCY